MTSSYPFYCLYQVPFCFFRFFNIVLTLEAGPVWHIIEDHHLFTLSVHYIFMSPILKPVNDSFSPQGTNIYIYIYESFLHITEFCAI